MRLTGKFCKKIGKYDGTENHHVFNGNEAEIELPSINPSELKEGDVVLSVNVIYKDGNQLWVGNRPLEKALKNIVAILPPEVKEEKEKENKQVTDWDLVKMLYGKCPCLKKEAEQDVDWGNIKTDEWDKLSIEFIANRFNKLVDIVRDLSKRVK